MFAASSAGTAVHRARPGKSGRSAIISADRNVITRNPVSTSAGIAR
jgi:hypothetical protein